MLWKRKTILNVMVLAALAAPISLAPGAAPAADGPWVRVASLCAQAKDCEKAPDYICSPAGGDKLDEKCSAGCDSQIQVR